MTVGEIINSVGGRIRTRRPLSVFVDTEYDRETLLKALKGKVPIDIHVTWTK